MQNQNVFQLSTLNAVMLGEFEPAMTVAQLKLRGDLGIGTFTGLGGELILLDGRAWNGTHTGEAVPVADDAGTPFACAVRFAPESTARLEAFASFAELRAALDRLREVHEARNRITALHLRAADVRAVFRSFAPAPRPWKPMKETLFTQKVTEMTLNAADFVGFRFPAHLEGVNMPGWHLHVLSAPDADGRRWGGHLLDLAAPAGAEARLMTAHGLDIAFPTGEAGRLFDALPLESDLREVTAAAEG